MRLHRWNVIITCLFIFLFVNLCIYYLYSLLFSTRQRMSKFLINSGITINSFNSPIVYLTFNTYIVDQSSILSIIDNNAILVQSFKSSELLPIKMILPDGFHHLDIFIIDEIQNYEFYQEIDISTGTHSLFVIILDQQYKPVENISVHLELVDYSHINLKHYTNHLGEVIFHHLPRHTQVYIEAICMNSKRYAFIEIDTLYYRNITLILNDMSTYHYDEYDSLDQGYYAI